MPGPNDPNGGANLPPVSSKIETLTYICEIILELRQLGQIVHLRVKLHNRLQCYFITQSSEMVSASPALLPSPML